MGDSLTKVFGSRTLVVDGNPLDLEWSEDTCGMLFALPATMFVAAMLSVLAARQSSGWARNKLPQRSGS